MTRPNFKLTLLAALTLASCSQVLGIDDYQIDDELDGAPAGGDSADAGHAGQGTAGAPPQGGSSNGGQPSESGAAGEPSTNGGSSAGESGAAGAGPGEIVGCDGTPFEPNEAIIRSCILRVGCQPWAWPTDTISRCVSQNAQATYQGTECTLDATTCADITECEGKHVEDEFCADQEAGMYCNGNEVVVCGDYNYAENCDKSGGVCFDFGVDLDGLGTTVACSLPDVTACTATTVAQQCGGPGSDYRYLCEGTIAYGSKCGNFAASCDEIDGEAGCYYAVNTCTTEGVTCSNDRASWCGGGTKAVFDCGSVGLGCQTTGDYTSDLGRQCTAPGCTSDDLVACTESCDGTKLTLCYGGAPVTVDCKDYGFKACNEYTYDLCDGESTMNDCVYVDDVIKFAQCE